jgi:golgi-specific brefeldin A-resistance guanine nucleotide exchange factor 1
MITDSLFQPIHGRSQTEWNLVFALIRSTMAQPEAARMSFDLIEALVADGPDNSVSLDNFSGLLTILDDFATSASMLQEQQQERGRRKEPLSSSTYLLSLILPFVFLPLYF